MYVSHFLSYSLSPPTARRTMRVAVVAVVRVLRLSFPWQPGARRLMSLAATLSAPPAA